MSLGKIQKGIVCAIWTPFADDGGVAVDLLDRHLEWLKTTELNGIMALGSTGRFVYQSPEMRESFLRHLLPACDGLPVVANVSDLDPDVVARLGGVARECGAEGISVLPRWYFEQSQSDLEEWFVLAAEAAKLPLWIYTFPERTGNIIHFNTIKSVGKRVDLGGFKNSGDNHEFIKELAPLAREMKFSLFAGADARIPESLDLGAVGCIGGLANVLPEAMVKAFKASEAGDVESAADDLELLRTISKRMHLVPFPYNVAAVMEARGIPSGSLPRTMSRVTRAHFEQLKKESKATMDEHGLTPPW